MPFAVRNGVTFHMQELGPAAGRPPPVVMLHGLLVGNLATRYFSAAQELAMRHRVLLYDLRGHGRSERAPRGYDVATMAADLAAIVNGFTSEPVALVGHSYGAVVALRYALDHPGRVAKLGVVEAPLPPSRLEELNAFLGRDPEQMADALPEALRSALGQRGRRAKRFVESVAFLVKESSLLADLRAAADVDDAALASLRCPLLCVYGTESSCRPIGRRLARAVPGARLVEIEGGHFLPVEAPARVTALLSELVDG